VAVLETELDTSRRKQQLNRKPWPMSWSIINPSSSASASKVLVKELGRRSSIMAFPSMMIDMTKINI